MGGDQVRAVAYIKRLLDQFYSDSRLQCKLSSKDCAALVDKITARIRTWHKILKEIEMHYSRFLYGVRGLNTRTQAQVLWTFVALPKEEGGVGIRDFKKWNQACVVRHIRNLLAETGSLWVVWVKKYRLKQKAIWDLSVQLAGTWICKRILKCIEGIQSYLSGSASQLAWDGKILPKYSVKMVRKSISTPNPLVDWFPAMWASLLRLNTVCCYG
ncbi:unnamed protein product [Linum tenue]|uniref:Reverse transcriptase n=1 Tax=Linum tenue TaxID=586396 RepID=A0AAV0I4S2_9ROSI|nr:unnamed protein product [Linum tenue]